jgi:hypothetical protein
MNTFLRRALAGTVLALLWVCPPATRSAMAPRLKAPAGLDHHRILYQRPYQSAPNREALLDFYFDQIKDLPFDYGRVGSVAEALGYTDLVRIYGTNDFEVLPSVSYHDAEGHTLGELDLTVIDRSTSDVVEVIEVKISTNLRKAGKLAIKQMDRLKSHLAGRDIARFSHPWNSKHEVRAPHFKASTVYGRMGNSGALAAGFHYELDLTRAEADLLQKRLLPAGTVPAPAAATRP